MTSCTRSIDGDLMIEIAPHHFIAKAVAVRLELVGA